jgi:hypothetical protein
VTQQEIDATYTNLVDQMLDETFQSKKTDAQKEVSE